MRESTSKRTADRDCQRPAVADERAHVAGIQRARIVAGMVEVVRERGVARVTVAHAVARSGVSRRTFYELFEDRDECLVTAFELAIQRAAARVLPAYAAGSGWRERIRAGLGALLQFLDDEPQLGALCVVDMLAAGGRALALRTQVLDVLIDTVATGAAESRARPHLTRLTAEGVVGAVLAVLHARLLVEDGVGSREPLLELLGPLMGVIVLPYQGSAAAAREAACPAPQARPQASVYEDVLKDLDMRLTYRTVRVLLAISARPRASNREIANAADVADQGQISKLLRRLEHLGLIENTGGPPAKGEANAWRLTHKGHQLRVTIDQTASMHTGAHPS